MFHINELVGWQRKILEHGPTWCIAIGSILLILSLFPHITDACRHKKTFSISKAFFILWGIGCLCMAGNSAMYFIRDVVYKSNGEVPRIWTVWLKHCSFAVANIFAAMVSFYAFFIKRKNVIESRKLGISEERYWETMVNYQYDDIILENTDDFEVEEEENL